MQINKEHLQKHVIKNLVIRCKTTTYLTLND